MRPHRNSLACLSTAQDVLIEKHTFEAREAKERTCSPKFKQLMTDLCDLLEVGRTHVHARTHTYSHYTHTPHAHVHVHRHAR